MSAIINAISVIKELIALIKLFLKWAEDSRKAEDEKRRQERAKAIEDSKKAETDEEIFDSQDRIVGNRPKP